MPSSDESRGVLVMTPRIPFVLDTLEREYDVHHYWNAADPAALLREAGPSIRAVVTNGVAGCPREVIDALPNLGVIAIGGVGLDAVDVQRARERGVAITTTPGVLTIDVADQALALLLAASRHLVRADRYVREGGWERADDLPLTWRVSGKRAGIIGLGQIGKAIARRLAALDMTISYTGRHEQPDQPYAFIPDVVQLARDSDVLVVSSAGGEDTRRLVNAEVLDALGPRGVLVNIARGSVVDEAALIDALQQGRVGAAGLDVFTNEPHVPAALKQLDNVVLAPHAGTRTIESRMEMGQIVLDNLQSFFAGRPLLTPLEHE